jgi:DNA-binding response OmpR family regulator
MKTIVLIDDDEDFLEWVVAGLSRDGYHILTATTGKKGLALAESRLPDLVIVDIQLSDINGYAICHALRKNAQTAAIPLILVTGVFKEIEAKEKGYRAGADDFLVKPFSYEQLRVRVLRQLKRMPA